MFQVTAIYQDSEIGYGEGEGLEYAITDCAASIPSIFENENIMLSILDGGGVRKFKGRVYLTIDGESAICDRVLLG